MQSTPQSKSDDLRVYLRRETYEISALLYSQSNSPNLKARTERVCLMDYQALSTMILRISNQYDKIDEVFKFMVAKASINCCKFFPSMNVFITKFFHPKDYSRLYINYFSENFHQTSDHTYIQSSHYACTWSGDKLSYGFLQPLLVLMEPIYSTLALKRFWS